MNKYLRIGIVAALVIVLGVGVWWGTAWKNDIASEIEDWKLYQLSVRKISLSSCDNKDMGLIEQQLNGASRSELNLHFGLVVLQTENPQQWSNEKFRSFSISNCNSDTFIPLRAYPDKLLWKGTDCSRFGNMLGCGFAKRKLLTWEYDNAQSSDREFNEAGIHFRIPPHIFHTRSDGLDFHFYTEGPMVIDTSGITLSIPPMENSRLDFVKPDVPDNAERKMINWGNLQGDRYVYSYSFQHGDTLWQGTKTYEVYPVSYSGVPIVLSYSYSIHDDTLETLWSIIHTDFEMNLADNLGVYQSYLRSVASQQY